MQVNTYISPDDYEYLTVVKPADRTTAQQMSDCIREWIEEHKKKMEKPK
jgi:hypothetical protein